MDLIERNVLLAELRMSCKWHAENSRELSLLQRDINIVMEQPGIEAEPVRHSKWIPKIVKICGIEHEFGMKCERCGEEALSAEGDDFLTDYCPNCGAKMDEREKE